MTRSCKSVVRPQQWHSVMSTHLITEVKQQWARLVFGWMTRYGIILLGICFCQQTFINSSALLMSLMALQFVHEKKTIFGLVFAVLTSVTPSLHFSVLG